MQWDIESQAVVSNTTFGKEKITYAFSTTDGFYCVTVKENKSTIRKLLLAADGSMESYKKLGVINQPILNAKHLTITVSVNVFVYY